MSTAAAVFSSTSGTAPAAGTTSATGGDTKLGATSGTVDPVRPTVHPATAPAVTRPDCTEAASGDCSR